MNLSIIIVNYKTPLLVNACLKSVFENTSGIEFEVIVVDNDSGDDTELIIRKDFPDVQFIRMNYNAGFARANNEGIRRSKGEAVLLLNSDTIVEDEAITVCTMDFLSSAYTACGVQLLNPDRSPQISGNYAMKGGLNYLLPLPYVGKILRWMAIVLFKAKKPNVPEAKGIVEVDWINGAFLMVKKNAVEKAGLLDEDFFLYAEEAEWCYRLKKTGGLCIYGDLHVIHLQGESAETAFGKSSKGYFDLYSRKGLQIMVSNFLRIRKQFGLGWFFFDMAVYFFTMPFFFIGVLLDTILRQNKRAYSFTQWWGFCKNIFHLLYYSGKMIRGRRYFYKVL